MRSADVCRPGHCGGWPRGDKVSLSVTAITTPESETILVRPQHLNRPLRAAAALVAAGALLAGATGCTAGLGGPASSRAARDGVIRFTFAPDPIWDYMHDEGIVDQFEKDTGIAIETSATWDEFGLFAGGHADIISSASFE